jgi:hypothetical protein
VRPPHGQSQEKEPLMNRLFEAYRALHEQAFAPIFCRDEFDSRRQVEACAAAGCKGIEYTLRKADAREMIPWVRKNYPNLFLIVGSTIDSDKIIRSQRRKFSQLMTLEEISQFGVDGFISMLGWSEKTIADGRHDPRGAAPDRGGGAFSEARRRCGIHPALPRRGGVRVLPHLRQRRPGAQGDGRHLRRRRGAGGHGL